jgi:hypothetical protein
MIKILSGEAVRIHRLIQNFIQSMLTPAETAAALSTCLSNVISMFSNMNDKDYSPDKEESAYKSAKIGN